jgi:hypothetical protein
MWEFHSERLEESFARFERAAAKGHEQSFWIGRLVKDVEMEWYTLIEPFAKTDEPLGWYFAGELSFGREQFDFYKKSAEGGCSWGQSLYGRYFQDGGEFVGMDEQVYLEWLEKAANRNNPEAMDWLGDWFRTDGGDKEKAVSYFRAAAELGWKFSMNMLAQMLRKGQGCAKDLRQAVIWSAKGGQYYDLFWDLLGDARRALESEATEELDYDFNQLCYDLGWGLYWHQYDSEDWNEQNYVDQAFGERCLNFYCSCVDLQQKSIFTFLWFWNRTTGGVKGPGQIIAEMVWELREDNLVKMFE